MSWTELISRVSENNISPGFEPVWAARMRRSRRSSERRSRPGWRWWSWSTESGWILRSCKPTTLRDLLTFATSPIWALNSDVVCQMARLGFIFPSSNRIHVESVSRVVQDWDLWRALYQRDWATVPRLRTLRSKVGSKSFQAIKQVPILSFGFHWL